MGRVTDWLVKADVDVLAMQEIKCKPEQFPVDAFEAAGYELEIHGANQWNGVAFASRLPMEDARREFTEIPRFGKPGADGLSPVECRALAVTVEGVRLWSLYVPNGRALDDPHYTYKLEWLDRLAADTRAWIAANPETPLALMGDWNIAPFDYDVWDIDVFEGSTHVSEPERERFRAFEALGLSDVVRERVPDGYTYWDYKQLRFPRNEGMRIDFIMGTRSFDDLIVDARIERNERKGETPSDHVPVVVDLDLETALDDDRPMIF